VLNGDAGADDGNREADMAGHEKRTQRGARPPAEALETVSVKVPRKTVPPATPTSATPAMEERQARR